MIDIIASDLIGGYLKLLVALEALLAECDVTRAASRIGVGQPAMSNSLGRLRRMFDDELLTHIPGGMQPTPRAIAPGEGLREALARIRYLLARDAAFDTATATTVFKMGVLDSIEVMLNRQAGRYAREDVPLSLSTLADQVGACAGVLEPLFRLIAAHVMAAGRLHRDDTTVRVLAKGKTSTGRVRVYVRDARPFGGADPPAALFRYSPDRRGEHPQAHLAGWSGVLQADAYGGYGRLYGGERKPAPITEAACWAHARRKFFELADIEAAARQKAHRKEAVIAPLALDAVRRMDVQVGASNPTLAGSRRWLPPRRRPSATALWMARGRASPLPAELHHSRGVRHAKLMDACR